MEDEEKKIDRPWLFKKGQSGNPGGRKKGSKSLKTYAREMLENMNDEERLVFMEGLPKDLIWKMAEGNPKQDTDVTSGGEKLETLLVQFIDSDENSQNTI